MARGASQSATGILGIQLPQPGWRICDAPDRPLFHYLCAMAPRELLLELSELLENLSHVQ